MYFLSLLNQEQQEIYKNITQERMNIYLQGFVLGIILGIIYLKTTKDKKAPTYCIFVAIVLGVTYIHYTLMPKSTYMLEHIETAEQAKAWLEIYRMMKKRCHMGMVLGVVALPFICYVV
jgi:heme/copper-type cytochrome/quinol oxidase subunit 4